MPGIFFNYELAPVMVNRRYVVFQRKLFGAECSL